MIHFTHTWETEEQQVSWKQEKKVKKKNVCKVYHQIEMGLGASDEWSLKLWQKDMVKYIFIGLI